MTQESPNSISASVDPKLVLTRIFAAPRHLVFEAWTKKEQLDRWSAPRGFTIPYSEADFRPGGVWKCLMVRPDGEKYPVKGVYREIIPDELLVFTHIWEEDAGTPEHETVVTVRFADAPGGTRVTLGQGIFKSRESRDGHEGGWTQCFDLLGELLAERQNEN